MIHVTGDKKPHPLYRQVAEGVAAKIRDGYYLPGHPIPSESTLVKDYNATRNTVREAIKLLREMDLIVTEHGRASYVREAPDVRTFRLYPDRVEFEDGAASHGDLDVKVFETTADRFVAVNLRVDVGTPLIARRSLMTFRGVPHQLSTSYLTRERAAGTPLAEANKDAVQRTEEHLAALGVVVTATERYIRARMPTLDERDALRIGARPVLTITRVMLAGGEQVEAADVVIRADAVEVHHRIGH